MPNLVKPSLLLLLLFSAPLHAGWLDWWSEDEPLVVTVNSAYIDVYTGPGRGYPIFYALEKGETITLLKSRTGWIKVATARGQEGWVKRDTMADTIDSTGEPPDFTDDYRSDAVVGQFELGAAFGDFDGADSTTLSLGYRFTRNLTIEARYGEQAGSFSDSDVASLGLTHQPFPEWRVSPYLGLGAGIININPSATLVDTEDREDTVWQASLGTYVYLSRRFFLRLDYTNHYLLTSRETNDEVDEWRVGFNVFF
ncbi:outer membrane beta-barrel protein [Gilvimarinus xylanilyticus]|uniref:SH3 domain-containing protein n=1 Tax=Gilvimarinus xylanilyticus TaxID=2944139 RepID=A0A9X2I3I7_9GAMM|nr:SH3 domain-containing protein [Gilvimarinus xylanilyticus]MCP8899675.1 SH3 domain-containing protein [Gilvimarinus xylanilyticus]